MQSVVDHFALVHVTDHGPRVRVLELLLEGFLIANRLLVERGYVRLAEIIELFRGERRVASRTLFRLELAGARWATAFLRLW